MKTMGKQRVFLRFTIRKLRAEFDGETQAVCGALIPELEELHQKAIKKCEKAQKEKHKIRWVHVFP